MLDVGAEQLLSKVEQLFQGKEELIANGKLRVCLTATVVVFLNECFENIQQHTNSQNRKIEYLKECVQSIHTLKIVKGPTFKFNHVVDISHFKAVQALQIEEVAIGHVSGLQTLRSKIKVLKLRRCVDKIDDVLTLCGYDLSSAFPWSYLEAVDLSFNTISSLDSSLRLLTSVRCLNLSNNELTSEDNKEDKGENGWMYLPEVMYLDLGCNQLTKVPSFPENCCSKITILILRNNDLDNLQGVELLTNLESLDVSTNCISDFSSLPALVQLHRLVSICCHGNPVFYDARYRNTVVSCLSPSPRQVPIVLDGKELNVKELYNLGQSLEVDLSSYIPSRPCTPVHIIPNNREVFVSSGEHSSTPRTPEEKRKGRKAVAVRQPSIHNIGDEQPAKPKPRTVSVTRVDTKEELEKLEKFKKDAGEDYLVVRNQEQLQKNSQKKKIPLDSSSEQPSTSSDIVETAEEDVDVLQSPTSLSYDTIEVIDDGESGEIFLVSVKFPKETRDMFVTVKDDEIVEKNEKGRVTSRLDLNGLLDVDRIPGNDKVGVSMKFSHVHKDRQHREYLFDDEDQCQKFVFLLKDFVQEPVNEDNIPKRYFKCIRCSKKYKKHKEFSQCKNCGSSIVVEVGEDDIQPSNTQQEKPDDVTDHAADIPQDPDVIPNTVRNTSVPPDICISENEKVSNINENYGNRNPRDFDNEYGALVSSIRDQTKEKENLHEDSYNSEDYDAQVHSVTQPLLQGHNNSPSAAMNISLDSLSGEGGQRSYNGRHQESPLASSYSSQSGSDTRNSTPVSGKTSSKIIFSPDSCTDCDHRLKLYLETKLFRGSDDEEFRCMIKCAVASYGYCQGIAALLVISNTIAYICKITGIESTRPKEWLSIKACYLLTDLRYIEYGLQSQSFRLEFAEQYGCHAFLVGDGKRSENFLTYFRSVVKNACGNKYKPPKIGKMNPQTLTNIRIQVFGVKDESLMFKGRRLYEQAMNFTDPPLLKDHKVWFRSLPQSMLGEEFIDWLIIRKEASSFREAVNIGQLLLNAGAIQCFNKDCGFLEKDQYYYFNLSDELHEDEVNDISQGNTGESEEVNTTIKQYILAQWRVEEKSTAVSIIITNTHIALAEENHQWPLPRLHDPPKLLSGPQFVLKKKQRIINITDVELFADSPCEIEIEFRDEDTPESIEDDRWLIVMQSENSLTIFLDAVKELWEKKFGIDLPVNILNKME